MGKKTKSPFRARLGPAITKFFDLKARKTSNLGDNTGTCPLKKDTESATIHGDRPKAEQGTVGPQQIKAASPHAAVKRRKKNPFSRENFSFGQKPNTLDLDASQDPGDDGMRVGYGKSPLQERTTKAGRGPAGPADLATKRNRLGSCLGVVSTRNPTAVLLDELLGESSSKPMGASQSSCSTSGLNKNGDLQQRKTGSTGGLPGYLGIHGGTAQDALADSAETPKTRGKQGVRHACSSSVKRRRKRTLLDLLGQVEEMVQNRDKLEEPALPASVTPLSARLSSGAQPSTLAISGDCPAGPLGTEGDSTEALAPKEACSCIGVPSISAAAPQAPFQSPSLVPPQSPGLPGDRAAPTRNSGASSVGFPLEFAGNAAEDDSRGGGPPFLCGSKAQASACRGTGSPATDRSDAGAGPPDSLDSSFHTDPCQVGAAPTTPLSRTRHGEGGGSGTAAHSRRCTGVFAEGGSPDFEFEDLDAILALEVAETQSRTMVPPGESDCSRAPPEDHFALEPQCGPEGPGGHGDGAPRHRTQKVGAAQSEPDAGAPVRAPELGVLWEDRPEHLAWLLHEEPAQHPRSTLEHMDDTRPPRESHHTDIDGGTDPERAPCKLRSRSRAAARSSRYAEVLHIVLEAGPEDDGERLVRLLPQHEQGVSAVTVHLRDGWIDTPLVPGDSVHLLAPLLPSPEGPRAVCDYKSGLFVVEPDRLVSGTRVAGSFRCLRQAVLEERFGGKSGRSAVEGTLLHSLLQVALREGSGVSQEDLQRAMPNLLDRHREQMLEVSLPDHEATARLQKAVPAILQFCKTFLREVPGEGSKVRLGNSFGGPEPALCIPQVLDIEENIWAPKYGLKGMIDASLHIALHPASSQVQGKRRDVGGSWLARQCSSKVVVQAPGEVPVELAPLEFKTGRPHHSHRAQVLLYLLLMEERYGKEIEKGLLWYLGQMGPEVVTRAAPEVAALLMQRNRLVAALRDRSSLPALLRDPGSCSRCFHQATCALTHLALEGGDEESAGMGPSFLQAVAGVSPSQAAWLRHWLHLLDCEEAAVASSQPDIWHMPASERQAEGRCLADLLLDASKGPRRKGRTANGGTSSVPHPWPQKATPLSCPSVRVILWFSAYKMGRYAWPGVTWRISGGAA
eukprot:jgi/Botrbrau1/9173/Bobra.0236s0005.1